MGHDRFARWAYRGGRPNGLARVLNRGWAIAARLGIAPELIVTLEVRGRKSGRTLRLPLVPALHEDERYLVSMLGEDVAWVKNVRAAGGEAVLHQGRSEPVVLEEVPVAARAPIIKAYVKRAPGGRPHIAVDPHAPVEAFEAIADDLPVFRVTPAR